MSQEKASN